MVVFLRGDQHTMRSHVAAVTTPLTSIFSPGRYDEPAAALVRRRWKDVALRLRLFELRSAVRPARRGAANDVARSRPRRVFGDRSRGRERYPSNRRAAGIGNVAGDDAEVHHQRSPDGASGQCRDAGTTHRADVRRDFARVHAATSCGAGRLARRAERSTRRQSLAVAARESRSRLDASTISRGRLRYRGRCWPSGSRNWSAKRRCGTSPAGGCSSRSR